jgi:hypothetical protein
MNWHWHEWKLLGVGPIKKWYNIRTILRTFYKCRLCGKIEAR